MKYLFSLALLFLGTLGGPVKADRSLAELHPTPDGAETNGGYIVVLKDDSDPHNVLHNIGLIDSVSHVYHEALKGFAGHFSDEVLDLIRAYPDVDYVEHDLMATSFETQNNAGYNLAMISEPSRLTYFELNNYTYLAPPGGDVTIYILDTGIYTQNVDFGGRARSLYSYYGGLSDVEGHGTHVAGVAGGRLFGVAKAAELLSIKVLNDQGKGANSAIIGGIDIAVGHCNGLCVVNLSLGSPRQASLNQAATNAAARNLVVVAAAGNENQDACNVSPASAAGVIAVAANSERYERAPFSNFGHCVSIFAAGVDIISAGTVSPSSINVLSGTSQAAPAVAGLAAYYLSRGVSPGYESIFNGHLKKYASFDYIFDTKGSPNYLANNGYFQGFFGNPFA